MGADVDDASGYCRGGDEAWAGSVTPAELAGRGIEGVQVPVHRTDIEDAPFHCG